MIDNNKLLFSFVLFASPLIVAAAGLGLSGALLVVVLLLAWRWGLAVGSMLRPDRRPELVLETISASHYVEKVRWALDRLGVEYREAPCAGAIGAFFAGRTVPRLDFRTGAVRSSIGNSSEILRYLWGRYGEQYGTAAEFLRPTPERRALEKQIDRVGVDLQVWVYYHLLDHRDLTLRAWGVANREIPGWQRRLLPLLFPLLRALIRRSFRITPSHYRKAVEHVDTLLSDAERRLGEHPDSLSPDGQRSYVDYGFAAINGLWLQPEQFGRDAAAAVRIAPEDWPDEARRDVQRWRSRFPRSIEFIESLYQEERLP